MTDKELVALQKYVDILIERSILHNDSTVDENTIGLWKIDSISISDGHVYGKLYSDTLEYSRGSLKQVASYALMKHFDRVFDTWTGDSGKIVFVPSVDITDDLYQEISSGEYVKKILKLRLEKQSLLQKIKEIERKIGK